MTSEKVDGTWILYSAVGAAMGAVFFGPVGLVVGGILGVVFGFLVR